MQLVHLTQRVQPLAQANWYLDVNHTHAESSSHTWMTMTGFNALADTPVSSRGMELYPLARNGEVQQHLDLGTIENGARHWEQ